MIPYGKQLIGSDDIKAVVRVLKSAYLTQGPKIQEFEQALAKYCGAKYAVAVCNGTAALHLAYMAAGLKKGDEVITTPNTFAATTNMLFALGVKPVFVDINLSDYNIDAKQIEKTIARKTRAIVAVHFSGAPINLNTIWAVAKKHKLIVIEDGAQALGAGYKGKKIGGGKSDMVTFSFHPVKTITTGEGGAVLTNSQKYYERLKLLRSHGIVKDRKGWNVMEELSFNYRLTDLQAALGLSQLKKANRFVSVRRALARYYNEQFKKVKEIVTPKVSPLSGSAWHLYVIRTKKATDRDPLAKYLLSQGIGINFHYPAVYSHPFYRRHGYKNVKLPNMEEYQRSCVTLPLFVTLKRREIDFIVGKVKEYYHA